MEILHLKGVAFSRPEAYKGGGGGGGGAHHLWKGELLWSFFLRAGGMCFFLLVFKGSYRKYLFLQM